MAFVLSTEMLSNCMSNTHAQKTIFQNMNPRMDNIQDINKSHTLPSQILETRIMNLEKIYDHKLEVTPVFQWNIYLNLQCSRYRSKAQAGLKVQSSIRVIILFA